MYRLLTSILIMVSVLAQAQSSEEIVSELQFRSIGPAFTAGRIADVVKDPDNPNIWYVAVASGNVWKTLNNGTTWKPVFDDYPVYSTGCLAIDPNNTSTIWLGTGENQSQRSVGWGDGVYKSDDGGESWRNVGLNSSEHIGKILIDPRNSNVVYVASQGPLWKSGGDRGVFKTSNGGLSWDKVLSISENTGIADLAFDPGNPEIIYATSYQRRRHVGILIAGGPESRIYKTTDGGANWKMLTKGLPSGDLGRIAIAVSPQQNNVVYALISGEKSKGGFYRSTNKGESWSRQSDYQVVDPQYYGEIYCDPHRFDHVYAVDMMAHFTIDGGKTFNRVNSRSKHVDNHAILFDPIDPNYIMIATDGGIYESWDRTKNWKYIDNLPIMQFYRVGLDNDIPFYNVYGGTQDNSSIFGPSQTISRHGINNRDWTLMLGGDGFQTRVDPENSNTVYTQSQYAGIVRYDRTTGQRIDIQPRPGLNDEPLRWYWDSPLIISPHDSKTLYYAAQKLFKSTDRGDSWTLLSPDLSRGGNRNERKVMGQLWQPEAVWKNVFTSPYGTIVSLAESPIDEGLLIIGTDDGLIQISEDGGENWTKSGKIPNVPGEIFVADVIASYHDRNVFYAVLNNHKEGDFKPNLIKSTNLGKTWEQISSGINPNHSAWTMVEDHKDPNLLFLGTEFGLWCSLNGGSSWTQMKNGLPTTAIRDLEIQQRENDLVLATFGRGFYILDDYSVLRELSKLTITSTMIFTVNPSWIYFEKGDLGYNPQGTFGNSFYVGENAQYGTRFQFYIKDRISTEKDKRKTTEFPSYDQLKAEDQDDKARIMLRITDNSNKVVSLEEIKNKVGFQMYTWNHQGSIYDENGNNRTTPKVIAGIYRADLISVYLGVTRQIADPISFELKYLELSNEKPSDNYYDFFNEVAQAVMKADDLLKKVNLELNKIEDLKLKAVQAGSSIEEVENLRKHLEEIRYQVIDDPTLRSRSEYYLPGVRSRLRRVYNSMFQSLQVTQTQRDQFKLAQEELLRIDVELTGLLKD